MEKVLTFKYSFEQTKIKDKLKAVLSENHIEFICYESNNYYPHEFIVRKSGRKWNDLYSIINSVKPAKYSFKNTVIDMYNGKLVEVVHC